MKVVLYILTMILLDIGVRTVFWGSFVKRCNIMSYTKVKSISNVTGNRRANATEKHKARSDTCCSISYNIIYVIKSFKLCKQHRMNRSGVVQFMESSQLRKNHKKKWSVVKWNCITFCFYSDSCSRSPVSVNTSGSFSGQRPSSSSTFIWCVWIIYERNF